MASARMSDRRSADEEREGARLGDPLHGAVVEREAARWNDEADGDGFAGCEPHACEPDELANRTRDGRDVVATVELHYVLAGSITHVGDLDLDDRLELLVVPASTRSGPYSNVV